MARTIASPCWRVAVSAGQARGGRGGLLPTMSIAPIDPPVAPIAEATCPITSRPRSNSTRRISENCADGEDLEEAESAYVARRHATSARGYIGGEEGSRKRERRGLRLTGKT